MKKTASILIIFLFSCGFNHEPTIDSITADPNPVSAGEIVTLTCTATDDEGADAYEDDKLEYTWDATAGVITQGTSDDNISWTSPQQTGVYSISCVVNDPDNGVDIATIDIVVQ
tara:strand:- start:5 stop:346 length:342 start_codon:yes stop_codon:yes gene_type:complete